jgi:hypothetical protein
LESDPESDQINQIPRFQHGSGLLESLWNPGIFAAIPTFQLSSGLLELLWNLGISQKEGAPRPRIPELLEQIPENSSRLESRKCLIHKGKMALFGPKFQNSSFFREGWG